MDWQATVLRAIRRICKKNNTSMFDRQTLLEEELDQIIKDTGSIGATPEQTTSRILQALRDQGIIEFVDNNGLYRLL